MTDIITLLRSDDPPKALAHSRAVLAAHSTVFRDMLSLPASSTAASGADGTFCSINVAEKEAEITPFLFILTGQIAGPFVLSNEQWMVVARLANGQVSFPRSRCFNRTDRSAERRPATSRPASPLHWQHTCRVPLLLRDVPSTGSTSRRTTGFRSHFSRMSSTTLCAAPLISTSHSSHLVQQTRWKELLYQHALRVGLRNCPDSANAATCEDGQYCNQDAFERAWLHGVRQFAEFEPSRAPLVTPFFTTMINGPYPPRFLRHLRLPRPRLRGYNQAHRGILVS